MRGKAGAIGCVVLLLAGMAPMPAAAAVFGSLNVSAPDWQLIELPYNLSVGPSLFQTAGDLNGDGFDDLVVWRGGGGFVLFNGSAAGLDLQNWRGANGGLPGSLLDTGSVPSYDARPTGVDGTGDGIADMAGYVYAGAGCTETPLGGPSYGGFCIPAIVSQPVIAWGNASKPLRSSEEVHGAPHKPPTTQPSPVALHLVGVAEPETRASVLGEQVSPRSADGRTAASTNFTLYNTLVDDDIGNGFAWQVNEPSPLASAPRPPRFIAAPDFDGDGYADIVTWAPPGQAQSGPLPGILTIYNGSAEGLKTSAPLTIEINGLGVLIADFDGNGRPDVAYYRVLNADNGGPRTPYVDLILGYTQDDGIHSFNWDQFQLEGPSIFLSAPPVRLQAGDIDGDGRADLVAMKYDTTSAQAGHMLVDVFLGIPICPDCDRSTPIITPSLSSEVQFTGTDIYANEAGLRVNLQADYDGDGMRDLTVGFYGGNSQRAPTNNSSFVAVMYGRDIVFRAYGIGIDADAGGIVYPMYRSYTVTAEADGIGTPGDLELGFPALSGGPTLRINTTTLVVTTSDEEFIIPAGPASVETVVCIQAPCPSTLRVPLLFNWSIPNGDRFGLSLRQIEPPSTTFLARVPVIAEFHSATAIAGDLQAESEGRTLAPGGWVRGGATVNLTSSLAAVFAGSSGIHPAEPVTWRLASAANATVLSGDLNAAFMAPGATTRGWVASADFTGLPPQAGRPSYTFQLSVDADVPQFGDHLPLETDWATSHPVYFAAQIFDNESGVDPARIEYTWQNDIDPFLRWSPADWMPGQTAAEVVAHASIFFPEGNLSNIVWRAWDRAGNGPVESPIWGVKVDTHDVTFHDPSPDPSVWNDCQCDNPGIGIIAGASGVNFSSVAYRLSTTGPFGFGEWISPCPPESIPQHTCVATFKMNAQGGVDESWGRGFQVSGFQYVEGDTNWVQWRAASNASGVLRISDPYQIRFDSLAPTIVQIAPNGTTPLPLAPVELRVSASEGNADNVVQRGLNLSAGAATYRVRPPGHTDYGPSFPLLIESSTPDRYHANFTANLTLERGQSTVEVAVSEVDGKTTRAEATVRINQLPIVNVDFEPSDRPVEQGTAIRILANATDPDGDLLTYTWAPCAPSPRPGQQRVFSTNDSLWLLPAPGPFPNTNKTGDIQVCLTVRDTVDGVVNRTIVVHVVPPGSIQPPQNNTVVDPIEVIQSAAIYILLIVGIAVLSLVAYLRRRLPPDNL